jgi:DNA-binding transcriptional ArsR family regulator
LVEYGSGNGPSRKGASVRRGQNPFAQLKALLSRTARSAVELTEEHILLILAVRRGREAVFGRDLFSDPAWDVLLELYAANLAGRNMTAHDLAAAIDAPRSTIGRWIEALADRGLVTLQSNSLEPTSLSVSLSADGVSKMKRLADQWGSAFTSV